MHCEAQSFKEIHHFGFVSIELHLCPFTPGLACVYYHLEFASISSIQTQIVHIDNSLNPTDPLVMRNSGISGKYRFQLVYKVRHQSPKKSMAKPTPLRSSMHDVDTATLGNPWMQHSNLDYVKPFSEVLPDSTCIVLFTQ